MAMYYSLPADHVSNKSWPAEPVREQASAAVADINQEKPIDPLDVTFDIVHRDADDPQKPMHTSIDRFVTSKRRPWITAEADKAAEMTSSNEVDIDENKNSTTTKGTESAIQSTSKGVQKANPCES
ncbi:Hypothetical predicted protein [Mytilus galloprovincialis]|uniref:Uncharacterized protein n=1 Tax=Mytilus galloprovincialis TaxID=29158 RepID=A0A8B6FY86_MYTGA|nr:Hypothetical predicted protein [Mytilus galloprovincialis]